MTNTTGRATDQAAAQYSGIVDMVQALSCDYDHLEELKDEKENIQWEIENADTEEDKQQAENAMTGWMNCNDEDLRDLLSQANGNEDQDSARKAIQEDPLSVEVRSGWGNVGSEMQAEEFCILLCTGGPAVRIRGELDNGTPCRAWMEYQDWGTGWIQFYGANQDTLLVYSSEFYFGDN